MILFLLLALADVPDGRRLQTGETCYAIRSGDRTIGAALQRITRARVVGVDALRIVNHQRVGTTFDLRDELVVRRRDLRPLTLDSAKSGKPHVHLDYADARVTGWKMGKAGREAIDVALAGPTWDGNLWGTTFAALPLRAGGRYTLPFYQYDKGLGSFDLAVKGEETVQQDGKPVAAWIIDASADPARRTDYLIAKSAPRELGYRAGPMAQMVGGDCTGLG